MSRLFRVLALSFIVEACILCPQPSVRPAGASPPLGYTLVWSDEFNGPGSVPDPNHWNVKGAADLGDHRGTRSDAVSVDGNGHLVITTFTKDGTHWTSLVSTGDLSGVPKKFDALYGYVEASIDFDGSPGMWSSFFLTAPDALQQYGNPRAYGTEMDIVEHKVQDANGMNVADKAPSALHWDGQYAAGGDRHFGVGPLWLGFHTYGMEWTPNVQRFYYDGVLVWTVHDSPLQNPPTPTACDLPPCSDHNSPSVLGPVSHTPQYIILKSELGETAHPCCGTRPSSYGSLDGPPPVSTTKMKVDYVRFYQDVVPPAAIANLSVSRIEKNSMTVSWTAPGDDGTGQPTTEYDLRYKMGTLPIDDLNWNSATRVTTTAPHAAGFPECRVVAGLSACRTYYFAIKAKDEFGNWSAISNPRNASTLCSGPNNFAECVEPPPDVVPPGTVNDLSLPLAGGVGTTTMAVTWTEPGDDGSSGIASEYDLRYSTSLITASNFAFATPFPVSAPGTPGVRVCRLVKGLPLVACTPYYFAIKTKDEWGNWSAISNILSAATDCGQEPIIADCNQGGGMSLQPAPNEDGSLSLSFSPPSPNPARSATSFQISIPGEVQGAKLRVGVFDIAGRRVRSLVDRIASQGRARVEWNLLDGSGQRVAPAVYMVRVEIGETRKIFPLVVVR